jgi:cysteine-rich repeat protein
MKKTIYNVLFLITSFALVFSSLLLPSRGYAVTAKVCVRNDGVGTFENSIISFFANSDWDAGDRTASGPGTAYPLDPGDGHCVDMTGVYVYNGFQYTYLFQISFYDTNGFSYFYSPPGLQFTEGTWYVSDLGITSSDPGIGNYISIINNSPPPYGSIDSYANFPDFETECYIYWGGLVLFSDYSGQELQRSSSSTGPWTTIRTWGSWGTSNATDSGLNPGTTYYYRMVTQDDYGAKSTGNLVTSCTTNGSSEPECGDNTIDSGEMCDDGNNVGGDGCSGDCLSDETCGNGIIDSSLGEDCDDGNSVGGDGCSGDCLSDETCGNGIIDSSLGEDCDDGNSVGGDGCSGDCLSDETCGNGIIDIAMGEDCDDGNSVGGDGCSSDCLSDETCGNGILDIALGEDCDDGNSVNDDDCTNDCLIGDSYCGDGVLNNGEDCDDGNIGSNDGCSPECTLEDSYCGDGVLDEGEECDDGNREDQDGCSSLCMTEETICGDGVLDDGEDCDDGNSENNDGCSVYCIIEEFFCGDGVLDEGEECDDGNREDQDGCSSICMIEETPCGDGVLDDGEECDDGNTEDEDGCSSLCLLEASSYCGDGVLDDGEECDDGNTEDDDGCSGSCFDEINGNGVDGCSCMVIGNENSNKQTFPVFLLLGFILLFVGRLSFRTIYFRNK